MCGLPSVFSCLQSLDPFGVVHCVNFSLVLLKSLPSRIGNLLDISLKDLEKVLYCESYMVTNPGESTLREGEILTEEDYREAIETFGYGAFEVGMGGEVIRDFLARNLFPTATD